MKRRSGRAHGFTLIELMVVVANLGIAVTVGWTALSTIRRSASADLHLIRVTTALESEMDRLRAADKLPPSGPFVDPELRGVVKVAARRQLTPIAPGLTRVTLTVRWRTPTDQPRKAALVSLVWTGRRP